MFRDVIATCILTIGALMALLIIGCVTTPQGAWEPNFWNEPEFVVVDLPQVVVQKVCAKGEVVPPGRLILGCVQRLGPMRRGEACVIHMSSDIDIRLYREVLRHEKAHCRGWQHGQPAPEGAFV